jgi:hypothetical protein
VELNFEDLLGNVWLDDTLVGDSLTISPKDNVVYGSYGSGPLRHIGAMHYANNPIYFDDFSVFLFLGP